MMGIATIRGYSILSTGDWPGGNAKCHRMRSDWIHLHKAS